MKFMKYFLFLITIIITAIILWGMNRGFDISDEGFYLLHYQDSYYAPFDIHLFYKIVKWVFGFVDLTIINLRVIRLILIFLSGTIFTIGLMEWTKDKRVSVTNMNNASVFLFILLGCLISYGMFPQSLSYDSMNSFIFITSAGLFFYAMRDYDNQNKIRYFIPFFIIGFLLSLQVFIKVPSFLLLFVSYIVLILLMRGFSPGYKVLLLLILFSGFAAGLILYNYFVENILISYNGFRSAQFIVQSLDSGYKYSDLFINILRASWQIGILIIISLILSGLFFILRRAFRTSGNKFLSG